MATHLPNISSFQGRPGQDRRGTKSYQWHCATANQQGTTKSEDILPVLLALNFTIQIILD
jgi:hypothetical protein